jgi:hypothetical protein
MSGFERWSKARRARIIAFDDIAEDRLIRAGGGIPPSRNVRDAPPPSSSALPTGREAPAFSSIAVGARAMFDSGFRRALAQFR